MSLPPIRKLSRSVAGKVVLVTGAGSGMGRATAHVFAAEGAKVAATDVRGTAQAVAEEIKADVLAHGVNERGVFTQRYGDDALDASLLLVPLLRFLPPDDPRVRATVLAIADELTVDGLVLRYKVEETDDGLSGEEGTFTICSFWLVSALVEIGELHRAKRLCERLLGYASPLKLYAEEIDAKTGQLLGAHMVGAEVTELIQGYVVAMTLETTEEELMHTVFPHPTLSEMMHESVLDAYGKVIHT